MTQFEKALLKQIEDLTNTLDVQMDNVITALEEIRKEFHDGI